MSKRSSEREQLLLFRALPAGDMAVRDAQDLMAYPFFSLAKSPRIVPIHPRIRAAAPVRLGGSRCSSRNSPT